jgi:hypothetical protein
MNDVISRLDEVSSEQLADVFDPVADENALIAVAHAIIAAE